jgi:Protein of unknown function (DUF998)
MEGAKREVAAAKVEGRDRLVAAAGVAGIAGPIVFVVVIIVQGLLQPDYSHVTMPVSALAAWPLGWMQEANFFVFSALMTGYAIGLHLGVGPGKGGLIGPVFLLVSGAGLLVAGLFSWSRSGGAFVVPVGHVVGAFMSFLGAGLGLIVMSRRMTGDPRWRGVAGYALASGVAIAVLFLAFGKFARPPGALLYEWRGIVQRVIVAVWFSCTIVLAQRLRRTATSM